MEQRKRKSALENYVDSLMDPPEKLKKMTDFYSSLKNFYRRKWNAILKLPCVQGVELNLFRMYDVVMSLGGWQKVSQQEKWPDVAEMLGVGEDVMGGDHAIKLLYMRFLSKFEQIETIGDIDEMIVDGEISRSRGRQASCFATNECPISMPSRHFDAMRREHATEPDYSRVMRSLLSGLPNEVDFGINVCTLLSHPGPRLLRLSHVPHIPILLVAHCGIFDDESADLSDLYSTWKGYTQRDFLAFWANCGASEEFLKMFVPEALKIKLDPDGELLHGINLEYDVRNSISWRLNQIATIIRNFSFEPINRVSLTQCWPIYKLLFLCASCKYVPLFTAAMDTLSNIACDINLTWQRMTVDSDYALLRIIKKGLESNDKFMLVRSLEILTGLCLNDANEGVIVDFLTADMFDRIFDIVCVRDIMMCVYALECLYQLSEMGPMPCDIIANRPRFVQQLVSMATMEAVTFGQVGLAGMKVVEYQPNTAPGYQGQHGHPMHHAGHQGPHGHHGPPGHMVPQGIHGPPGHHGPAGHHGPPGHHGPLGHPGHMGTPNHNAHSQYNSHPGMHGPPQNLAHPSGYTMTPQTRVITGTPRPLPQVVHIGGPPRPVQSENKTYVETLTEQWIRTNCIGDPQSSTPRGELYAAYVDDLRSQYHSLSGSLTSFTNTLKAMFPDIQIRMVESTLTMVVLGIRLIKPHRLVGIVSGGSNHVSSTVNSHPLMKQILTKGPTQPLNGINGSRSSNESSRSSTPIEEKKETESPSKPKANGKVVVEAAADSTTQDSKNTSLEFMCEWDGCGSTFSSSQGVLNHCLKSHMIDVQQPCKWPGCDGTPRSRWSLVTHLLDHHTQEGQLRLASQRRRDGVAPSKPTPYQKDIPRDIPPHPGYSKHAAIDAIRRHAFNYLPRDITDEAEGPVTKSIRLTSCLILRNLARFSPEGRHLLKRHESQICWLALSRLESSHALGQLLGELNDSHSEDVAEE